MSCGWCFFVSVHEGQVIWANDTQEPETMDVDLIESSSSSVLLWHRALVHDVQCDDSYVLQ